MMESRAMTAEQQGPKLQQTKVCSNATAIDTEIKKGSYLPLENLRKTENPREIPLSALPTFK